LVLGWLDDQRRRRAVAPVLRRRILSESRAPPLAADGCPAGDHPISSLAQIAKIEPLLNWLEVPAADDVGGDSPMYFYVYPIFC
jgi:hypothetical protein